MDVEGGFVFQPHDEAGAPLGTASAGSWIAPLMQQYDCSVFKKQLSLLSTVSLVEWILNLDKEVRQEKGRMWGFQNDWSTGKGLFKSK